MTYSLPLPIPDSLMIYSIPDDINSFLEEAIPHFEVYTKAHLRDKSPDAIATVLSEFTVYLLSKGLRVGKGIPRYKQYSSKLYPKQPFIKYIISQLRYLILSYNNAPKLIIDDPRFDSIDAEHSDAYREQHIQVADNGSLPVDRLIYKNLEEYIRDFQFISRNDTDIRDSHPNCHLYDLYLFYSKNRTFKSYADQLGVTQAVVTQWTYKLRRLIILFFKGVKLETVILNPYLLYAKNSNNETSFDL